MQLVESLRAHPPTPGEPASESAMRPVHRLLCMLTLKLESDQVRQTCIHLSSALQV